MSGVLSTQKVLAFLHLLVLYVSGSAHEDFQRTVDTPDSLVSVYSKAAVNYVSSNRFGWNRREIKKGERGIYLTKQQTLDLDVAKKAAHFASITYCHDSDSLAQWNCTRCSHVPEFVFTDSVVDIPWNVYAYVGYYPPWNAKIVAFRGTDGSRMKNWIENVKATQHHVRLEIPGLDDCLVHNGFSRIWNFPFKSRILTAVKNLNKKYGKEGPLYLIGHSAGGATAQLAAMTVNRVLKMNNIHLYTFGAPRVGNKVFARTLTQMVAESWRFTHMKDIVPTLPWMTMGFWHVGQEVFEFDQPISKRKTHTSYKTCDGSGEDPSCHNSMCPHGFGCRSITDHIQYMNIRMEGDGVC